MDIEKNEWEVLNAMIEDGSIIRVCVTLVSMVNNGPVVLWYSISE